MSPRTIEQAFLKNEEEALEDGDLDEELFDDDEMFESEDEAELRRREDKAQRDADGLEGANIVAD